MAQKDTNAEVQRPERAPLPRAKNTASSQLLLPPELRNRQAVLAAVAGVPLAEIGRILFEVGLPLLEQRDKNTIDGMQRLKLAAARFDMAPPTLAKFMIDDKVTMADLFPAGDSKPWPSFNDAIRARDERRAGGVA